LPVPFHETVGYKMPGVSIANSRVLRSPRAPREYIVHPNLLRRGFPESPTNAGFKKVLASEHAQAPRGASVAKDTWPMEALLPPGFKIVPSSIDPTQQRFYDPVDNIKYMTAEHAWAAFKLRRRNQPVVDEIPEQQNSRFQWDDIHPLNVLGAIALNYPWVPGLSSVSVLQIVDASPSQ